MLLEFKAFAVTSYSCADKGLIASCAAVPPRFAAVSLYVLCTHMHMSSFVYTKNTRLQLFHFLFSLGNGL